jgi:hypothetical protein
MGKGGTEYPKDRVADELRHGASVALDDCLGSVKVPTHHSGERFGVKALTESCRAHHVAEQDRDGLADLLGRLLRNWCATHLAEARTVRVLLQADRAGTHSIHPRTADLAHLVPLPATSVAQPRCPDGVGSSTQKVAGYCRRKARIQVLPWQLLLRAPEPMARFARCSVLR